VGESVFVCGTQDAARVGVRVSVFVWGAREAKSVGQRIGIDCRLRVGLDQSALDFTR